MGFAIDAISIATTHWDSDDGPGWWIVFPITFWVVIITGLVVLVRSGRLRFSQRRESALEVLDRRFAEGEMTAEEYHERRSVLDR